MTPITWQAAVDDEEQGHCCKTSSKQPSVGIMSRENSRGGFALPSSLFFLLSSVQGSSRNEQRSGTVAFMASAGTRE